MSILGNYTDDPTELTIEARGALRACLAISEEFDAERFDDGIITLDPRDAEPCYREASSYVALLGAINAVGGLGALRISDEPLAAELVDYVVPFFKAVAAAAHDLLWGFEDTFVTADASEFSGRHGMIEALQAVELVAQASLTRWGFVR